jgi:hypothetical protein
MPAMLPDTAHRPPSWGRPKLARYRAAMAAMLPTLPAAVPTAPLVATGLIGGYAAGRASGRRELAGVVLAAAGAVSARAWQQRSGPAVMGSLLGVYAAAFGLSHPLAKKIGAWPSVLSVSAAAAAAAYALADRRGAPRA